jgi:predicted ribosome quality control (RQC) complex YloA/Tae2 family protein
MKHIGFDLLTLKAFINENRDFLTDARIQKIQQPTRQEFIFSLRNLGESRKLYISIQPNLYHLCFMSKENEGRRLIEIPQFPPMFCMQLRKYLEGRRIIRINEPENERIIEFYFKTGDENVELCLAIELMGKYSNVILYNYDTNVILGCAHNVGAEKSRERVVSGTLPYTYPQKQDKKEFPQNMNDFIADTTGEDFTELLAQKYYISQGLAEQVCKTFKSKEEIFKSLTKLLDLKDLSPSISKDFKEFALYKELLSGDCQTFESVNEMIDEYFSTLQQEERLRSLRSELLQPVNVKLKKVGHSLKAYDSQIDFSKQADNYRKKGDLLMANLYNNQDFVPIIEVFDYENNKNIKIELDKTLSLKDNANKFYKQYNKAKISAEKSQELKAELLVENEYLDQIVFSIETATTLEEFAQIREELGLSKDVPKSFKKKTKIEIEQKEINGFTVLIGKNNKQNDHIVSKLSKDEDIWFHTRLCAGSHVLLRNEAGKEPDEKTLFECAKLAKLNSKAKDSSKVSVIFTKRKFLKKPPAANLGYVTYKNEKEIIID